MVQRYENGFMCEKQGCFRYFEGDATEVDLRRASTRAKQHQSRRDEHVSSRFSQGRTWQVVEFGFGEIRVVRDGLDAEGVMRRVKEEIEALRPKKLVV